METILRFLNVRTFVIAGIAVAVVVLAGHYRDLPRQRRADAAARGTSPLAKVIAADLDRKDSQRLHALHKAVSEEIAAAEAKGFDVARLKPIADQALALDTPEDRPTAMQRLYKLRMAIPQTIEAIRPAADDEEPSDVLPPPKAKTARAKTRAKKAR